MRKIITIVLLRFRDKRETTGRYLLVSLFRVLNNLGYISTIYKRILEKKKSGWFDSKTRIRLRVHRLEISDRIVSAWQLENSLPHIVLSLPSRKRVHKRLYKHYSKISFVHF